jgi:zinc transport system permease protein
VIPAVTARRIARSPEQMALVAPLFGIAAVAGGLALSTIADTPSGPSIVLAGFLLFLATTLAAGLRGQT